MGKYKSTCNEKKKKKAENQSSKFMKHCRSIDEKYGKNESNQIVPIVKITKKPFTCEWHGIMK